MLRISTGTCPTTRATEYSGSTMPHITGNKHFNNMRLEHRRVVYEYAALQWPQFEFQLTAQVRATGAGNREHQGRLFA